MHLEYISLHISCVHKWIEYRPKELKPKDSDVRSRVSLTSTRQPSSFVFVPLPYAIVIYTSPHYIAANALTITRLRSNFLPRKNSYTLFFSAYLRYFIFLLSFCQVPYHIWIFRFFLFLFSLTYFLCAIIPKLPTLSLRCTLLFSTWTYLPAMHVCASVRGNDGQK